MTNFCSINLKYTLRHYIVLAFISLSIVLLISYSNCTTVYKLNLFGIIGFMIIYTVYHIQNFSNNSKLEILFDIQNILISKNNKSELYEITNWYSIGSWCVIINLKNRYNTKNLIIAKHSCELEAYKYLLRNVTWHHLKIN